MVEITPLQEIKFLLILGLTIMGWQAAVFLIYKYYKMKDENVKLNRILLSYGFLTLMGMFSMLILAIISTFVTHPEMSELLRKFSYLFAFVALLLFWAYLGIEQLSNIVNFKIMRVFFVVSFIPIIFLLFLGTESAEFRFSLLFILLEAIFIVYFQIKLIFKSSGTVRNRFLLIFFAGICAAISMMMGANSALGNPLHLSADLYDLTFFSGAIFMFGALVLLYISIYNFPPILEFKWQEHIKKLVIFNQNEYSLLFYYDFPDTKRKDLTDTDLSEEEKSLFSGGLGGIDSIVSAITNTQEEKISKIKQGNSYILLDYGEQFEQIPITYALIVKENLRSIRYFLSNIKNQFESFYKEILLNYNNIKGELKQLLGSFEVFVKSLLRRNKCY